MHVCIISLRALFVNGFYEKILNICRKIFLKIYITRNLLKFK
ncbi:hypothetical protein CLOLEP_01527 [[Clostridium] leptum DSM 753]|uniref:Uncharacterized protein n=1 Tax=[Clostridium] leptum DSM 753 TaxID=428125 RepID=A7VSI6_9FIRM|nr:hypothetical protein CLOLEP_01527 [[Clostridium] leptum DSM 753]